MKLFVTSLSEKVDLTTGEVNQYLGVSADVLQGKSLEVQTSAESYQDLMELVAALAEMGEPDSPLPVQEPPRRSQLHAAPPTGSEEAPPPQHRRITMEEALSGDINTYEDSAMPMSRHGNFAGVGSSGQEQEVTLVGMGHIP